MSRRARLALLIAIVALPAIALARPGGGESYSGGGGFSSGGGGGGSSGGGGGGSIEFIIDMIRLIYWIVRLVVEYPYIGVPAIIMVVGYLGYSKYVDWKNKDWNSGPGHELQATTLIDDLVKRDPNFSRPVFEDFVFRLYAEAQRAAHDPKLIAKVAPYVSASARDSLAVRTPAKVPVIGVVIGALRVTRIEPTNPNDGKSRIHVEFEANLEAEKHTYYVVDRWQFVRDAAVKSRAPDRARLFKCPNCDAPWAAKDSGGEQCASCDQIVANGRFDWVLDVAYQRSASERGPTLTQEVEERGTDLKTFLAPGRDAQLRDLTASDPGTSWSALDERLGLIYKTLNGAWAKRDLRPARGVLSDGLYDYMSYWIKAYELQHLRNELVDMRITKVELAKVTRDAFYDAVTIRLWGTGKDFVIDDDGKVVRGSRTRERAYSEYWTLIRRKGRTGAPKRDLTCGNCGAPLDITQSGECTHCGVHVTAGEFDWVLSKIEQDDSYRG